ncbi:MAG: hypothetical protein IMF09_10865 [Proteobacteria bacterium]|nr:hypothetical protein [Pseudomonadota bacterium]
MRAVYLLLILALIPAPAMARDALPTELVRAMNDPRIIRHLEQNEIPIGSFASRSGKQAVSMWAAVLISGSIDKVHEAIIKCEDAPQYYKHMVSCEVLEHSNNVEIVHQKIKLIWFLPQLEYTFRADYSDPLSAREINFRTIRYQPVSGDLKILDGGWNLYPYGTETLAVHYITIQPSMPLPGWIIRRALQNDLPESLEIIRNITTQEQ